VISFHHPLGRPPLTIPTTGLLYADEVLDRPVGVQAARVRRAHAENLLHAPRGVWRERLGAAAGALPLVLIIVVRVRWGSLQAVHMGLGTAAAPQQKTAPSLILSLDRARAMVHPRADVTLTQLTGVDLRCPALLAQLTGVDLRCPALLAARRFCTRPLAPSELSHEPETGGAHTHRHSPFQLLLLL
jgi:hypothetical protein